MKRKEPGSVTDYTAVCKRREYHPRIWIGKMKELYVYYFGIEILPKLKFHEKNVMKKFWIIERGPEEIALFLRREDRSIQMSATDNLETNKITEIIMEKISFPSVQEREGGQEMFPF
ncbi:MAG: uncharacterized protein A8A55_3619, partial [Amphiamblys sp. WSBS2006]